MDKLKNNGFNIKYIHPNTLFISWMHWVPSYVREELKKKTGLTINEYGQKITDIDDDANKITFEHKNPNDFIVNMKNSEQKNKQSKKEYTSIKTYKPSGNLIYGDDLLNKIEDKFV
jgi:hypothetical protein